jgi:hypothetical protein
MMELLNLAVVSSSLLWLISLDLSCIYMIVSRLHLYVPSPAERKADRVCQASICLIIYAFSYMPSDLTLLSNQANLSSFLEKRLWI